FAGYVHKYFRAFLGCHDPRAGISMGQYQGYGLCSNAGSELADLANSWQVLSRRQSSEDACFCQILLNKRHAYERYQRHPIIAIRN
ncbi:hypothetical protein HPB47_005339, partial [Ixodes persulcatus]